MSEGATPYPFYTTPESDIAVCDYTETLDAVRCAGGCDLVLMSPPYDDARTYGNGVSWTFADYQKLGDATFAALKPGAHALVVLDGPVRKWRKGFGSERSFTSWKVMLDWAERVGFRVPDRLAYARVATCGEYLGRFRNDWQPLLWFQRPGAPGFFDKKALAEKSLHDIRGKKWNDFNPDGSKRVRRCSGSAAEEGLTNRGTLWDYRPVRETNPTRHPARFCLALAEDVVRCFCPPGGLVVDPFVGSGTSAVASVRHGRRFGGGDLYGDEAGKSWALHAHERVVATDKINDQ
jgi:hypothetical protein